ncbi:hypothetical protein BJ508DRAFT_125831 [Ascobolus immersus RN42]|uniref:Uncharacterized protein n=1 Tax=Ascobolus immersus RN42 TaxID=1160509 RepID=A0A3N4I9B7_ASCIM|nr:hypothetical protein BJ508DRAFT_125831 [Ascobolus immersus RN42]
MRLPATVSSDITGYIPSLTLRSDNTGGIDKSGIKNPELTSEISRIGNHHPSYAHAYTQPSERRNKSAPQNTGSMHKKIDSLQLGHGLFCLLICLKEFPDRLHGWWIWEYLALTNVFACLNSSASIPPKHRDSLSILSPAYTPLPSWNFSCLPVHSQ